MARRKISPPRLRDVASAPFSTSEEAWLWYYSCQNAREIGARFSSGVGNEARPCDPDDVYVAVMNLFNTKKIDRSHLKVLGEYGAKAMPPDPRCDEELKPAQKWQEALNQMTTILQRKGIVA